MLIHLILIEGLLAPPDVAPRASDEFAPVVIEASELPIEPAEPEPLPEPATPDEQPASTPTSEPSTSAETDPVDRRCLASRRCAGMRIGGGIVGGLGLAAVATGIGLLVRPDEVIPERPAFVTSTRPAGLATLTLGVGVTLTAVLILVASRSAERSAPRERARVRVDVGGLRF